MTKTEIHKQKILEILRKQGPRGINSRYLINEITPRYSARLNDLKKEGYYFRTKREPIGGSNLIRIWLVEKQESKTIPQQDYTFIGSRLVILNK